MTTARFVYFVVALLGISSVCTAAEVVVTPNGAGGFGSDIRDAFFAEGAQTGTIVDFTPQAGGVRFSSLASAPGVTFESNISTNGTPTGGLPVVGSIFSARVGQIVGTPFSSGTDDGRMGYQMVFNSPQQYAGIQRNWNSQTLTQFYSDTGVLLYELTGEATPYVGFTGNPSDSSTWVKRIQIDTTAPSSSRQVGYSADLIYGVSTNFMIPEPSTWALIVLGLGVMALVARRRH